MIEITSARVTSAGNAIIWYKDKKTNKSNAIFGKYKGGDYRYRINKLPEIGNRFRSRETLWNAVH